MALGASYRSTRLTGVHGEAGCPTAGAVPWPEPRADASDTVHGRVWAVPDPLKLTDGNDKAHDEDGDDGDSHTAGSHPPRVEHP